MKVSILAILLAAITGHVCCSSLSMDRKILTAVTENDGLQMIEQMGDYYKEKMMERFERLEISCDTCKTASEFIGNNIFGNDQIQEYVLRIVKLSSPCSRVPVGILRSACVTTLTAVFDFLWERQINYWTNAKICYQVRLCNSSELTSSQLQKIQDDDDTHSLIAMKKFNNNKLAKTLLCRVCEISTNAISNIVFENEQIKEYALNFIKDHSPCANVSRLVQRACFDTLVAAFEYLWQQTDKELSNGKICNSIRVCNGTEDARILQMVEDGDSCQFCEVMVSSMKPVVDQNLSFEETLDNLNQSCSEFKCKEFISNYGIKVAQMLEDKMSYQQICKAVDYCL